MWVDGGVTTLTRSTSLWATSSCQSCATCSIPNSFAIAAARSRLRLAIATIFVPMQSRKPGIWVVRANPVPMIPIPTGAFFMAVFNHRPHSVGSSSQQEQVSRPAPAHCSCNWSLGVATGEARDHCYELTGANRFGDVHLVTCRKRLATVHIPRIRSQGRSGRFATFLSRK
jgi:hypothetical protein